MDIEIATTEDILYELRKRGLKFVFIGESNTNRKSGPLTIVAAQASDRKDVSRLIRLGVGELMQLNDDPIEQE